ncbi:hypothetical protein G5V58_06615 [Nocardioides anomalus]|uniref:Uncharacterized protein n=1 Tax=Nocardioides anomalus TaxID=2712223 RepID=A0A6G6WAX8_9ACTN|nr:hypothetical protein [Nocardioides anomalus]QIG42488.1 hypothetical protein G5V58_06615 [Nocardioides anomalus]
MVLGLFARGCLGGGLAGAFLGLLLGPFAMWQTGVVAEDGIGPAVLGGFAYGGLLGGAVGLAVGLFAFLALVPFARHLHGAAQARLAGAASSLVGAVAFAALSGLPLTTTAALAGLATATGLVLGRAVVLGEER